MATADFDVVIVGAGLSGIGTACQLTRHCPGKTYAILERRAAMGGTWDLFRYPGIRSDSDMSTFGFRFNPWNGDTVLAEGSDIKNYIEETAAKFDVPRHVRYHSKVTGGDFNSETGLWTVHYENEQTGEATSVTAKFVVVASGYYDYDQGYQPDFPGMKDFEGDWVHPQFWPEDLDYTGKKVVVIGSGATAVTLIPSMADKTAEITMLQRSPTYVATVPSVDPINKTLRGKLPDSLIYHASRARNVMLQRSVYELSQRFPKRMKQFFLGMAERQLGKNVDMKHFTPSYGPWDQRLCAVPGGDLFKVLKKGKAKIVTDHIEKITKNGILLKSGQTLEADIIVSATGLKLQIGGGAKISVDGQPLSIPDRLTYKGTMLDGVPNAGIIVGYTNSSWTLKADIAAHYLTRVLNYMDSKGYDVVMPHSVDAEEDEGNVFGSMTSGYVQRGKDQLPRQGKKGVWRMTHNYFVDFKQLEIDRVKDDNLVFKRLHSQAKAAS